MSKTVVSANNRDTRLIVDKLVDALKEVYEIVDGAIGDDRDYQSEVLTVVERILNEFEVIYGKNASRSSN